MNWIMDILSITPNWLVYCFSLIILFAVGYFCYYGYLKITHALLAGIVTISLSFLWFTGAINCWVSDYECIITPNAIQYESREELQGWLDNCIQEMEENEGKFAGSYCSGGESGFADFNYYAKKESRRSK